MTEINEPTNPQWPHDRRNGRISGGIVLLLVGGALLARQMGAPLPDWLFTWPMILIAIGLYSGIKLRFRNPGWLIPTFIGGIFLADQMLPEINLKPYVLPIILIGLGLLFIFRPRRSARHCGPGRWNQGRFRRVETDSETTDAIGDHNDFVADGSDFIDTTSVFGGTKKNVVSKNFQGGDVTNFMGGTEINLTQADFNGRVRIDSTNVFGGTKLIVPAHWDVQSKIVAVFGGVDDKRRMNGVALDPNKVVVLDGTCFFGGIEINSY